MFFLVSVSFHVWYEHVREANTHAHFTVSRRMDSHWIQQENGTHRTQDEAVFNAARENQGQLQDDGRLDRPDGLASQGDRGFTHIVVKRYGAVSVRNVQLPKLGQGAPVGIGYGSRDSWSHKDITDQTGQSPSEAQPYIFYQNETDGDLSKEFLRL